MKVTSIAFLLIVFLSISSAATALVEIFGGLKTVLSIGPFIYSMLQKILEEPEKIDPVFKESQIIYTSILDNADALEALNEIPEKTNLINQVVDLYSKFEAIENKFTQSIKMYENIFKKHQFEHTRWYALVHSSYVESLVKDMRSIRAKINDETALQTRDLKKALVVI